MFSRNNRSVAQQLRELQQVGSTRHTTEVNTDNEHSAPVPSGPPKSPSWWNLLEWFQQLRFEGAMQTEVHASQIRNRDDLEKYRVSVAAQTGKHAVDISRLVIDQRVEQRAQNELRSSGVRSQIDTADAMEVCTAYIDTKIARITQGIVDPEVRGKLINELRWIHARQLTDIRVAGYGLKYDPQRGGREEDF